MYSDEHKQLLRAKRYAMEVSLKFAMRKQAEKKQKMQAQQVQRQRAVSIMCKIYVGSIYYEIGEQTIKQSFETFGPVRSIDMSYDQSTGTQRHKGFCFLEFEAPEAAFMALDNMQRYLNQLTTPPLTSFQYYYWWSSCQSWSSE